MAYELVKNLKESGRMILLIELASSVKATEKRRGKQHEIFELSFDWKECATDKFIEQKLMPLLEFAHTPPLLVFLTNKRTAPE